MPQYACGCWLEIYRPRAGVRCRSRWPTLCSLHDDGPDEAMLAAAEELAEKGMVSAPPPPPTRQCERCDEPVAPSVTHPRSFCARCERIIRRERAVRAQRNRRAKLRPARRPRPPKPPRPARAPLPERECEVCGRSFTPTRAWSVTCGDACRAERLRRRTREQWHASLEANKAAARERYHRRKAEAAGA